MSRRIAWLPLLLGALLAPPLLAIPEPSADELKANRVQFDNWRKHPEHLTRLHRNLRQFLALPAERREQILKLDGDLQQDPAPGRLVNVLERYVAWLDRVPEADHRAIATTSDVTARLALIQILRDREWMQTQPRALQKQWEKLKGTPRTQFVHDLRAKEHQRREQWRLAAHFWKELHESRPPATRLSELSEQDEEGVREFLMPMLSAEEKNRLHKVEGQWPAYLMTLVEIADRHPLALPSASGPKLIRDLPAPVRNRLAATSKRPPANPVRLDKYLESSTRTEKWPALAAGVVLCYRKHVQAPLPRELWACNYNNLLKPMQDYVDRLKKQLTDPEKERLNTAENNWPAYPIAIQELAEAHELATPPWNTALSGPRERWQAYRTAGEVDLLAVPQQVLQDFALTKMEPAKLAQLKLLRPDEMWRHLHAEYVKQPGGHGRLKMPHFEPWGKGRRASFSFGRDKR